MTTKVHAVCDAAGRPVALCLTAGQASDLSGFDELAPSVARLTTTTVIADKGYDADERVRAVLAQAGKTAVIPPRRNRKNPASYDEQLYQERHRIENFFIENFFSRLKDFRAIATRYDKTARNFLAGIYLAAAVIWIN